MTISTIKDLDKIMSLCRKQGVSVFKIDNVEFRLEGVDGPKTNKKRQPTQTQSQDIPIETPDELTEEQRLFYSATGQNDTGF